MIIAVNTRFLIKDKLEGIGYFTLETIRRITQNHPEHQFVFFFDRKFPEEFIFSKNITPEILFPPARHPLLWYWWFEYAVPKALQKINAAIFISLDGFLSLKSEVKTVLMIHDLAFEHFPNHMPLLTSRYYRHFVPLYAQYAARIAAPSEFTKNDIVRQYKIDESKIDIVNNAAKDIFHPAFVNEKSTIKRQYTAGKDYFLYVGAIQPRKNISNLFLAFDEFKKKSSSDIKLVIAGRKGWNTGEIFDTYQKMQFKDEVIFLNYLPPGELVKVMGASLGLVYVSLFEGFGVPVLEAMKCEVPVITSDSSSLPEVAGAAALFINPLSVDSIADGMLKIFKDENLRKQLIEKGKLQSQKYSWDDSAIRLWKCMEKLF